MSWIQSIIFQLLLGILLAADLGSHIFAAANALECSHGYQHVGKDNYCRSNVSFQSAVFHFVKFEHWSCILRRVGTDPTLWTPFWKICPAVCRSSDNVEHRCTKCGRADGLTPCGRESSCFPSIERPLTFRFESHSCQRLRWRKRQTSGRGSMVELWPRNGAPICHSRRRQKLPLVLLHVLPQRLWLLISIQDISYLKILWMERLGTCWRSHKMTHQNTDALNSDCFLNIENKSLPAHNRRAWWGGLLLLQEHR